MGAKFIGRQKELAALERCFHSESFEFVVVYGRRRVGKSTLLKEFIKDKDAIYFMSIEGVLRTNLKNLSDCILFHSHQNIGPVFEDYQSAIEYVFKASIEKRLVFIIDEYPYAARSDKGLPSTLQRLIDQYKSSSKLMLILCGSSISFMEDEVLAYRSPLYGRQTAQLCVEPFDFFDARKALEGFSAEDAAFLYGTVGGTPLYLERYQAALSVEENLLRQWFDPSGFFFEEPMTFIRQEVRAADSYFEVLYALASGASRLNEIAARIGRESSFASITLKTLARLGLVERETPCREPSSRRSVYRIADNLFRFWFSCINDSTALIAAGAGFSVLNRLKPHFSTYMGPIFEEISKQYLLRLLACGQSPVLFSEIGRWWGTDAAARSEAEIDIVAPQDKETALFGECKWTSRPVGAEVLEKLDDLSRRLFYYPKRHLYVFSRAGFTAGCRQKASDLGFATLVSFEEMAKLPG